MNVFTAIAGLIILVTPALAQEQEALTNESVAFSAKDLIGISTILIFFVAILLIVLISARSYSNTSKELLEKALEKNKEMPEELQEPVSTVINLSRRLSH